MQNVYLTYATPIFFLLILTEIIVSHYKKIKTYRINDSISSLGCGIFTVTLEFFTKAALLLAYHYLFTHFAYYQFSETSWVTWVVFFFVFDFVYYWAHRWSHEINFLWGVHVPHHQSEEYNLTTALRQGALQDTVHWPLFMTLAFMGCPTSVFITHLTFSKFYQFWIHTKLIHKVPLIEGILNTPSVHRVHHGINDGYIDKNHGGVLMIWDRLFGTFEEEKENAVFGVRKPYHSWNSVRAHIEWFEYLYRAAKATKSWKDKFLIWFKPTGWIPEDVAKLQAQETFDISKVKKFDTSISRAFNAYCIFQFILVLAAHSVMLQVPLTHSAEIGLALYVSFALIAIGSLLIKGNQFPRSMELLRQLVNCGLALSFWNVSYLGIIAMISVSIISILVYLIIHQYFLKKTDLNGLQTTY